MVISIRSLCALLLASLLGGGATLGVRLAVADPVPIRPLKPRGGKPAAQPTGTPTPATVPATAPAAAPATTPATVTKLPVCAKRRGVQPNGPDFTGTGIVQNPPCAPLPQLQAVTPSAGVSLDGKTVVRDFAFVDGELKSQSRPGVSLVGALLIGKSESGQAVRLRIDAVETAPDPDAKTPVNENADLKLYRVSAQQGQGRSPHDEGFRPNTPPTGQFAPLCTEGRLAVLVPGTWDYTYGEGSAAGGKASHDGSELTFACVGSAIAKCMTQMKYRPWRSLPARAGKPAQPFDELHQACVRAVRADYCGDGESMTQSGEQVNFYDRFDIERDGADWPLEAAWNADGALCVNGTRLVVAPENLNTERKAMPVQSYIKQHCPARLSDKPCDRAALAEKGALLWTEVAPKAAPKP
jgi:hypothetical protein